MDICELPVDVASKIVSYHLGKPEYMRLKHSKGLRKIQKRYKQIFKKLRVDIDVDDEVLYEWFIYKLNTKGKGFPVIFDILKEVDFIKDIVRGSYLRYIQPDMNCDVGICVEARVEMGNIYYADGHEPEIKLLHADMGDVFFGQNGFEDDGEFNIEYIIGEIYSKLFCKIDTFCHEEYDDVIIHDLTFNIILTMDNDILQ